MKKFLVFILGFVIALGCVFGLGILNAQHKCPIALLDYKLPDAVLYSLGYKVKEPQADYKFTAKDFAEDCIENHGNGNVIQSLESSQRLYKGKRIELKGGVFDNENGGDLVLLSGGQRGNGGLAVLRLSFRNIEDRKRFSQKDYVKISARFRGWDFKKIGNDSGALLLDFDDAIFIDKL